MTGTKLILNILYTISLRLLCSGTLWLAKHDVVEVYTVDVASGLNIPKTVVDLEELLFLLYFQITGNNINFLKKIIAIFLSLSLIRQKNVEENLL
jgi:hypothetical protein